MLSFTIVSSVADVSKRSARSTLGASLSAMVVYVWLEVKVTMLGAHFSGDVFELEGIGAFQDMDEVGLTKRG